MSEVVVTFQSKKDSEFVAPPMQVPGEFTAEDMEKFLNTLLSQDKAYAFFHKGNQIYKMPAAEKEETLNIEFIAVSKIMSESAKIDMDAQITAISVRRHPEVHCDTIVICTVTGETREYSLSVGQDLLNTFSAFKPIRAVSSTEAGIYVLTTTNKVVNVEKFEVVFESDLPIRTISASGDYVAIGLSTNEIVILEKEKEAARVTAQGEVGKVVVRKVGEEFVLVVGVVTGCVEVYGGSSWSLRQRIETPRPITSMGYEGEKVYIGGVSGVIDVCSLEKMEKTYQSDVKFISRIECGSVFFAYVSENMVLIRDKENFTGTHKIEMEGAVSDMKISGKRLFLAEGTTLKIFNIFDD